MPKLRDLRAVDEHFATSGPNSNTLVQAIDKPAAVLFRILEDGPAWKEWLGIDVEWTSPEPFGVGTTRTVRASGQTLEETFLVWDEGQRMNFRFDRTTLPMAAFAEDYLIVPTGDASCELHWSYAYEWSGPLTPIGSRVFGAVFAFNGRRALRKLAALAVSTTRFD
ncbi:MAG: SRPBCC family protein [Actinomycetota bacterium]